MKVVIFAGGMGSRLAEETDKVPKPMVEIGGKPMLWHIMQIYSSQGFHEFVILCGYKGHVIKEWFDHYHLHNSDIRIDFRDCTKMILTNHAEPWKVTLVDTGLDTKTAGRLLKAKHYLEGEEFFLTYGDGLADIDLHELFKSHVNNFSYATVTAVHPPARFGSLSFGEDRMATEFSEKPAQAGWINGGFFICGSHIWQYFDGDEMWEEGPLRRMAQAGRLGVHLHEGFWQCMDTIRDRTILEELWKSGKAPWMRKN